ncbi:DUF6414 family protein [Derxia lacustris]|uniref:DUF6414 family protein n=1 Tax=Derxia lacustris TaxID=764842 RepID=UPI00111C1C46|nr:hypothetical protein [Derxia lacustris]
MKNIIYLDQSKMFSLSAQIFEGITEYVLHESGTSKDSNEEQKGPVGSGRMVAKAMSSNKLEIEKRVLHDHAFSIFENRLEELNLISNFSSTTSEKSRPTNEVKSFVRIESNMRFFDADKITTLLDSFNTLGIAINYVSNYEKISPVLNEIQALKSNKSLKNRHNEITRLEKQLKDGSQFTKENGLYLDPDFLNSLRSITEYGFSGNFEVHQTFDELLFSACLKRDYLRESEDLLIRKYSRNTEKPLVLLGIATQTKTDTVVAVEPIKPLNSASNLKEGLSGMIDQIANIERSLFGKGTKEIVVDPIAIYSAL